MAKIGVYRCPSCKKEMERGQYLPGQRLKKWIKSYCCSTGKDVRIQLVKPKRKRV